MLDAWPLALALAVVLPLLTRPGLPLARDLIFVHRQPWTDAALGLSDAAPRAVPLDAVVSLLTVVVDGGVLARLALPLILATAGWGAHRLLVDLGLTARLLAGGLAVWNPYVLERLALGQWALLAAYAALPWLVAAAGRYRQSGRTVDLASTVLWAALASLTPTGGLLALLTTLVWTTGRAVRRVVLPALAVALLQLAWLVPALTGPAGTGSDPDGVAAFAARAEGVGGVLVALLGLGGIWDSRSVPATRETVLALVTAALVVVALGAGLARLAREGDTDRVARLVVLGAMGLTLAVASSTPPGAAVLRALVVSAPGGGLLRDSQKFLALFVPVVVVAAGVAGQRVVAAVARWGREAQASAGLAVVLAPLVLLPDGASVVWRTVDPVRYPDALAAAATVLDDAPDDRLVVSLPWRSYRGFTWGNGLVSADPAPRMFDRGVVTSDDLQVGDELIRGESPSGRAVGAALRTGRPADVLGAHGVGWVLVYRDDPDAGALDLTGLRPVLEGTALALYQVPEPVAAPAGPSPARRAWVGVGAALALLTFLAAATRRIGLMRMPTIPPG